MSLKWKLYGLAFFPLFSILMEAFFFGGSTLVEQPESVAFNDDNKKRKKIQSIFWVFCVLLVNQWYIVLKHKLRSFHFLSRHTEN